jgi:hypothetical protein
VITVLGPVLKSDGRPFVGRMRLTPLWLPMNLDGSAVISNTLSVFAEEPDGLWDDYNGGAGLQLAAGAWLVSFPSAPGLPAVAIAVPDGGPETEADFGDLIGPALSGEAAVSGFYSEGDGAPVGVGKGFYWDRTNKALYVADGGAWREIIA